MADGRHLEKINKPPYLNSGLTDRHEIWQDDAFLILTLSTLGR